jgi:hypothetical protein
MRRSPNRSIATIVGTLYLIAGIAGVFTASGAGFFSTSGGEILGLFEVNPFHDVLHILIGAALLIAGLSTVAAAKTVTTLIGTVCLVLGMVGLFVIGTPFNVLAMNGADNVLHFASAVLLLAVGLGAERSVTTVMTA